MLNSTPKANKGRRVQMRTGVPLQRMRSKRRMREYVEKLTTSADAPQSPAQSRASADR